MDIRHIIAAVDASGSHFFDKDSMRFFRSRVSDVVHRGPGGIFFVTSEQFVMHYPTYHKAARRYTVRQFVPGAECGQNIVERCPEAETKAFQFFANSKSAHRYAAKLAKGE